MPMRRLIFGFPLLLVACASSDASTDDGADSSRAGANGGGESGGSTSTSATSAGSASVGVAGARATGTGGSGMVGGSGGKAASGSSGAGGASGGGNVSEDAGAPHIVMPCPTTGAVGGWENITPAKIIQTMPYQGGTGAVLVNPKDTRTVYVGGLNGGGIFKSVDCGATWSHVNTGKGGSDMDIGKLWSMVIDPINPEVLYSINGYGAEGLWKTTNGGVDWENLYPPGSEVAKTANANFASIVSMDVTDHMHLVVAFHSGCSGAYAPNCQAESKDGGATWRLFKAPVAGEGVGVIVLNATTWISGGYQEMFETTDSGASWSKVSGESAHWQLYHSSSGAFYIGTMAGILKSTDGKAWSLLPGFSAQVQGITGDGVNIFAGQQWQNKYFKIPEANPAGFSQIGPTHSNSSYFMAFDPDHKLLYASEMSSLWRSVQK
jgi:hypothetical protein